MRDGQGRPRRRRRRSHRGQRRHRQQDRHLHRRGARRASTASRSTSRRRSRPSTWTPRTAAHPDRGARRPRGDARRRVADWRPRARRLQPGVRRDAAPLDCRHHHRARHRPRALHRVAGGVRRRSRSRLIDSQRRHVASPSVVITQCHANADPRHRDLLRRDGRRRRRGDRRPGAPVAHALERHRVAGRDSSRVGRRRARARLAPARARHLRRRRARARGSGRPPGPISARSPSRRGRGWSARCSSGVSFAKSRPRPRGHPARAPCIIWPATSSRWSCRTASCRCRRSSLVVSGGHTSLYLRPTSGTSTSCSAGRATTRRARRTTRSRSCSGSGIRAARSSTASRPARQRSRGATCRPRALTHARSQRARRSPGDSRLQLQRAEDRGAAPRASSARPRAAGRCRTPRSPTSARVSSAWSSTSLLDRTVRRRAARTARPASASPAACRPTAACVPTPLARRRRARACRSSCRAWRCPPTTPR